MIGAQTRNPGTISNDWRGNLRMAGAVLLVVAAATIPHAGSISQDFLYDDIPYIVTNPQVRGPELSAVFGKPLPPEKPELGLYRPLTVLTYRLQAPAGLLADARALHLVNLALHACCALVLTAVALALGLALAPAVLTGCLFAVHPACVESVAWIVGRAELLAALFCLLALLAHLRLRSDGWRRLGVGLALLAAAASKENALAFPAVLVMTSLAVARLRSTRRLLVDLVLFAAIIALVFVVRWHVLGRLTPDPRGAPLQPSAGLDRLALATDLLAHYLRFTIWPHPSRVFYHAAEFSTPGLLDCLSLAGWVATVVLAMRRRPVTAACLGWFVACLLPVLNIVPIQESFAERFLYLPIAGACLAGGLTFDAWTRSARGRTRRVGCSLAIPGAGILIGVTLTALRAPDFRSSLRLWEHEVAVTPGQAYAHYNLGLAFEEAAAFPSSGSAQRRRAMAEYRTSLEIAPRHRYAAYAHLQLAQAALNKGRFETAAHHYREAARLGRLARTLMDPRHRLAAQVGLAHLHRLAPGEVTEAEARDALTLALPMAAGSELQGPIEEMLHELEHPPEPAPGTTPDRDAAH